MLVLLLVSGRKSLILKYSLPKTVSFLLLPVVRTIPAGSPGIWSAGKCRSSFFFSPPLQVKLLITGYQSGLGCMDALYGAGNSQNNPTSSGNTALHCVRGATKGLASDRNAFCACQAAQPNDLLGFFQVFSTLKKKKQKQKKRTLNIVFHLAPCHRFPVLNTLTVVYHISKDFVFCFFLHSERTDMKNKNGLKEKRRRRTQT